MNQSDIVGPGEVMAPGTGPALFALAALLAIASVVALAVALVVRLVRKRRGRSPAPVLSVVLAVVAVLALLTTWVIRPPAFFVPEFPALPQLFPDGAFFYRTADDLPLHERSEEMVASLGALPLTPYAAASVVDGRVKGKPFNLVDADTERFEVPFTYAANSSPGPYPITDPAYIQSMPAYGTDEHYIGIDLDEGVMWEMWALRREFGSWKAGSGARWDLGSLEFTARGTTAAGLPMQPMDFTYEEVAAGEVPHVLFAGSPVVSGEFIWPARKSDGPSEDPDAPPMGTWLRLRQDVDLSGLGPQARVIATAMRDHGIVIGDTGGAFSIGGTPDARWDDADLATLRTLSTDDLEVVDASAIMVDAASMEAVPPESG